MPTASPGPSPQPSSEGSGDLEALAQRASDAIQRQHASVAGGVPESRAASAVRHLSRRRWMWGMWVLAVAFWAWHLHDHWVSPAEHRAEIEGFLEKARAEVDAHLRTTGQLPDRLADPAVAIVIDYQVLDRAASPPTFRLQAPVEGQALMWTNAK